MSETEAVPVLGSYVRGETRQQVGQGRHLPPSGQGRYGAGVRLAVVEEVARQLRRALSLPRRAHASSRDIGKGVADIPTGRHRIVPQVEDDL